MSNDSPVLTSLTENATDVPVSAGRVENYVLLLVLLCVFAGGTLVLLSLLLLFCHRCCVGGRRYSRASDDPEKTNTTYVDDSQPTQEINIRLDESDALSASSCHDGESDRFLSTGSTGRRVSFNESALYEQENKNQDKGRRYTLTEGDFHHLKKARLTHLHLAPPPSALKILTIMECESADGSTVSVSQAPPPKPPLAIYQPPERGVSWLGQSPSGGLPGDPHHSIILAPAGLKPQPTHSRTTEAVGDSPGVEGERERGMRGGRGTRGSSPAAGQTSVLQFFSKLRRHASLEGAGPYFRKWKFDSSHRAASLDAKGSPKRRPIHRQRAASDTTDPTEDDSSPLGEDVSGPAPLSLAPSQSSSLQPLSAGSLSPPVTPPSPAASSSRWKVEAVVEAEGSSRVTPPGPEPPEAQQREDGGCAEERTEAVPGPGPRLGLAPGLGEGTATEPEPAVRTVPRAETAEDSVEVWLEPGDEKEAGPGVQERGDVGEEAEMSAGEDKEDIQAGERSEVGLEAAGGTAGHGAGLGSRTGAVPWAEGAGTGAEGVPGAEAARRGSDSGSAFSCLSRQESCSLYRDIWSLRASLEQYASSDQSSTDRESIRSDADSVCSLGGAGGARAGLDSCLSQDLDDEPEGEAGEGGEGGDRGAQSGEAGNGGGGEGEGGGRKLLQMDSGYASIEAPSRAPEELRLFGAPGGPRGKSASERRLFFTSTRGKGSVCESFEARVFHEELEDEMSLAEGGAELEDKPAEKASPTGGGDALALRDAPPPPQPLKSQLSLPSPQQPAPPPPAAPPSSPHRPRLRRRDYSIDEKTDALFNEFLRHDPRFDQPDSPLRSRHRSRVHLRKQWQRHKQYSDPGAGASRYSPSLDRQRFTPLRRGDSAGYPLDTRYHSTLSRIASAADEEANEGAVGVANEGAEKSRELANQRAGGEVTGRKGVDCEGGSKDGTGRQESTNEERGGAISANKDQSSGSLEMDPRVDNRNNNSSQAMRLEISSSIPPLLPGQSLPRDPSDSPKDPPSLSSGPPNPPVSIPQPRPGPQLQSQSSLADKLAGTLEDRLYAGLRTGQAQGLGQGVVAISHASSPDHSPV